MGAYAGLTFILDIPGERTDHLWMVLSDGDAEGLVAVVMLTDVCNVGDPECQFGAGVRLADGFITSKPCCIDFARARLAPVTAIDRVLSGSSVRLSTGELLPGVLHRIRRALEVSDAAPPEVSRYCRTLGRHSR